MAVNRIPLYKNNYITLTQVQPNQVQETDANGTPYFKTLYESKTDIFLNKSDIISVAKLWDANSATFINGRRMIYIKNMPIPVIVSNSYNEIKALMNSVDENDLYDSGCSCSS